jgi:hypothetical protein
LDAYRSSTNRRHPIGIITKLDLVEQLDAAMQLQREDCPLPSDLAAQTADDVMMPIARSLDDHATIAHAAALMRWVTEHDVVTSRRHVTSRAWRRLES